MTARCASGWPGITLACFLLIGIGATVGLAGETVVVSDTFNRADTNDLGTLDNGLGGTIAGVKWVEHEWSADMLEIEGNRVKDRRENNVNSDMIVDREFTFEELGSPFAVEFVFDYSDIADTKNSWIGVIIGAPTNSLDRADDTDINEAYIPVGVLMRTDNWLVVWDGGSNGGGPASCTLNDGNAHTVRVEVATADYDDGTSATLEVYIDGVQFNNLRNAGLSQYTFTWDSGTGPEGKMTFDVEHQTGNLVNNTDNRYVDDFKILGTLASKGTMVYFR